MKPETIQPTQTSQASAYGAAIGSQATTQTVALHEPPTGETSVASVPVAPVAATGWPRPAEVLQSAPVVSSPSGGESLETPPQSVPVAQAAAPAVVTPQPIRGGQPAPISLEDDSPASGGGSEIDPPDDKPPRRQRFSTFRYNRLAFLITGTALLLILLTGVGSLLLSAKHNTKTGQTDTQKAGNFAVSNLPLGAVTGSAQLEIGEANHLTINGQLRVSDTLVLSPTDIPKAPVSGQIYFDKTTNILYYYNGTQFISLSPEHVTSVGGSSGVIGLGNGLSLVNNQLSVSTALLQQIAAAAPGTTGVTSLQGQTGDITLAGGSGISINGTTISNSGVLSLSGTANQISVSGSTGSITLSLPQDIATTSSPTFGGLTVSGTVSVGTLQQTTPGSDLNISAGNDNISFTAGGRTFIFPTSGPASQVICTTGVTCASGGGQAVLLQPGTVQTDPGSGPSIFFNNTGGGNLLQLQGNGVNNFIVTNDGAVTTSGTINGQTISSSASFTDTLAVQGGSLTVGTAGANNGVLNLTNTSNSNVAVLQAAAPTGFGNATFMLPSIAGGATDTICTVNSGNCAGSGGGIIGSGTPGTIAKFDNTNSITDSGLTEAGSTLTYAGNVVANAAFGFTGNLINLEVNNSSKLIVDQSGNSIQAGTLTVNGTGASSIAGNLSIGTGLVVTSGGANVTGDTLITGDGTVTGTLAVQGANALTLGTASTNTGAIVFQGSGGAGTLTLQGPNLPNVGNYTLSLPAITGNATVCTDNSICAGYAPASGSGSYIQNGTSLQTADFNISGTGTAGILNATSAIQLNGVNINTAGTLSNVAYLNQNQTFTGTNAINNTSTTAFQVQNTGGTGNLFVANTTDGRIGIGNAPTGAGARLTVTGTNTAATSFALSAGGSSGTGLVVSNAGTVGIGANPTANAALFINKNVGTNANSYGQFNTFAGTSSGANGIAVGTYTNATLTATGTDALIAGSYTTLTATGASDNNTSISGVTASATLQGANAAGGLAGGSFQASNNSTSTTATGVATGVFSGINIQNSNNVTSGLGFDTGVNLSGSGNISDYRGLNVRTPTGSSSGTIGTAYGVYINSLKNSYVSGTAYGLYQAGANDQNFLAGATTIASTLKVQGANALTLGTASTNTGAIVFQGSGGSGTLTLQGPTTPNVGNYTLSLPTINGNDTICTVNLGNCAGSGGGITGSGTTDTIALFTGSGTIGNSTLAQSGSTLTASGNLVIQGANSLTLGTASTNTGSIAFQNSTNADTLILQAGATGSNLTLTLPTTGGSNGDCLLSAGSGVLTFGSCTGGPGGGVTSLDGLAGVLTLNNSSGSGSAITIDDASTSQKGIAQFNSTNFSVTGGVVNTIQNIATTASPVFVSPNATTGLNTGAGTGTQRIDASGNLVNIGTITTSGDINGQTISSSANFTDTVAIQGANALTLGTASTNTGAIVFQGSGGSGTLTLQGPTTPNVGNYTLSLPTINGNDTICVASLANCTAAGTAGGDLTGSYPNPTIAKLQGNTLTLGSLVTGDVLQYNGSAIINGHITNTNLTAGTFSNITGVGVLNAGSITTGFGAISTANNISTTANLHGDTLTVGTADQFQVDATGQVTITGTATIQGSSGLTLGVPGTTDGILSFANATNSNLTVVKADAPSGTGNATITLPSITGGTSDEICLVTLGNCAHSGGGITGAGTAGTIAVFTGTGNSIGDSILSQSGGALTVAGNLIANTANGFTGNLINLEVNSSSKFTVDQAGNSIQAGTITVNGTGASSIAGSLSVGTGLVVTSGGANVTGDSLFKPTSNSATAFQIQNAAGNFNLFTADTINSRIGLGVTPINTAGSGLLQVGAINSTTAAQGISFGGDTVANLYRSAAGVLKTDGTLNATVGFQLNGININTGGTLNNVAYLDQNQTFTGTNTFSGLLQATRTGATALAITGAPTNSATSSLIQIGSAIAGGNAVTNGGTYLGLNAPSSGAGSAADFLNFQLNGTSKLQVTNAGNITAAGTYNTNTFNASTLQFGAAGAATIDSASGQTLNIGTGANSHNVVLGSTTGTSTVTLQSGTNGVLVKGATSATAFQIQNASSNSVFGVDTSANLATLGKASTLTGKLTFYTSTGGNTITLQGPSTNPTGNYTLTIPTLANDDIICTVNTGNCAGSGTGVTTPGGTLGAIAYFTGTNSLGSSVLSQASGNLTNSGNLINTGTLTVNNTAYINTNSTTALKVENSSGNTNVLVVDTTNNRVGLGIAPVTTTGTGLLQVGAASSTTAAQGISFGGDTAANLYRSGTGTLTTDGSLTVVGTLSSPGSGGTTSQHFGSASSVGSGVQNLAVGDHAAAGGASSSNATAIGYSAVAGSGATALGSGAKAATDTIALGTGADTSGAGARSIAIGINATTAAKTAAIAIGYGATNTAANQLVIGSNVSGSSIQNAYIGSGVTDAAPVGFTLHATGGSGTDIAGASLTLAGGQGTGAGAGGNLNFQIAKPGSTGASLNSLTTVFSLSGTDGSALFKNATDSTAAFQVQRAGAGGNLFTIDTTNSRLSIGSGSPATSLLTVGTNTTASSGGITFGTDTNLYRSGSGELTTSGNLIVSSLQANGTVYASNSVSIFNASASFGSITKDLSSATSMNDGDVVILVDNGSGTAVTSTTTTARDTRVYGVSESTIGPGGASRIGIAGHYGVNADTAAVTVGDQLVTSTTAGRVTVDNHATTGIVGVATTAKAGGSNGVVGVDINPVGGQYSPTFRNASNSTAAFQIQNAAGTSNLFVADTQNTRIAIGQATASYTLDVAGDINTSGVYRAGGTPGTTVTCSGGQFLQNQTVVGGITTNGGCAAAGGSGVTTVGTINSQTKSADGAVISGSSIYLQTADPSFPGLVSTVAQTFAGDKTFNGILNANATGKTAITIADSGAQNSGITIGGDTNLYRGGANLLQTDDALTVAGLLTGSAGSTISGGTVNLNASSNNVTNVNTGSSTGAVNIGNGAAGAITLQSSAAINITAGAASTIQTSAGNLTLQAGSGTVSLGTSTALTASSALAIAAGGTAQNLTLNGSTTGKVQIGSSSTGNIEFAGGFGSTGCTITSTGALSCDSNATFNSGGSFNGDIGISAGGVNFGSFTKTATAGTGGVSDGNVVVINSSAQVVNTTTARDSRVYGVAKNNATSGNPVDVAIAGNYTVNVDTVAVAIGDQLVTSTTSGLATTDNSATTGIIGTAMSAKGAGSTGSVSISIRPVNGQSTPNFRANSTTAFQIQNATTPDNLFVADTTNHRIGIGGLPANATLTIGTNTTNAAGGLIFGTDTAANLYRSATGTITTDGNFVVQGAGGITLGAPSTGAVPANGKIVFNNSSNTNTVTLQTGTTGTSYTLTLPTTGPSTNQCLMSGAVTASQLIFGTCAAPPSGLAKNAVDTSTAAPTAGNNLYTFTNSSSAVASGVLLLDNGTNTNSALKVTSSGNPTSGQALIFASNTNASPSGNLLDLQSGSSPTSVFSVASGGNLTSTSNSSTGFLVQDTGSLAELTIDTNGDAIQIGSSTTDANVVELNLDSYNNATDPTGVNGAMYYSTARNAFRCFENSAWKNCLNGVAYGFSTVAGPTAATLAKGVSTTILISPIYISGQITVNEMRVRVTTALGAAGDIGIYNSAGTLVLNGGSSSVVAAGTGVRAVAPTQTGVNRILEPGQYYIAVTWNSTTGVIAGANLATAGSIKRTGSIAGGGLVLPSTITPSSITDDIYLYGFSINN